MTGDESGIIKLGDFNPVKAKTYLETCRYGQQAPGNGVLNLAWLDVDSQEFVYATKAGEIMTGTRDSEVCLGDIGKGCVGLGVFNEGIIAAGTSDGVVHLFGQDDEELERDGDQWTIPVPQGKKLNRMVVKHERMAFGGEEFDLQVYDACTREKLFAARNVPVDTLRMRVPVWIKDMTFLDADTIATATAHKQVRLYDIKVESRRPVMDVSLGDYAFTVIESDPLSNGRYVVAGNGAGAVFQMDTRMNLRLVGKYKGAAGSVRHITFHPTLPYMATCGLDRHARVYNSDSKVLLHKIYLKSKLNGVLLAGPELEAKRAPERIIVPNDDIKRVRLSTDSE